MIQQHTSKIGVYVDGENIRRNGGFRMRYDVLRQFSSREGGQPLRLNTYLAFDPLRAKDDRAYAEREHNFHNSLRDYGFKIIEKEVKWYKDESGNMISKANSDLDLAVDVLLQSENLDRVLLLTGDGDFVQVVRALQAKGCRVDVLAFQNISTQLRREADLFMSGYLVPELLPEVDHFSENRHRIKAWGEIGSRVRGYIYYYNHEKHYGFIRYMKHISAGLWITDSRDENSPYETVFVFEHDLPNSIDFSKLPSRDYLVEFELAEPRNDNESPQAINITQIMTNN